MGTRLYPVTQNAAILEQMAEVPAGTRDRLTAKMAELTEAYGHNSYEVYEQIHNDHALGTLDTFLTFGWGRIAFIPEGCDPICGDTEDEATIRKLAYQHGLKPVIADLLVAHGGVCWS